MNKKFITKDSGRRSEYVTGMRRDSQEDKLRYDLIDPKILERWAELHKRGAVKYGENNWRKANTKEELQRFKASAFRHFMQWFTGDETEDHAVAVMFNITGAEYVKDKISIDIDGKRWYVIERANNYEVSDHGDIRRISDKKIISQWKNCWGYNMVSLSGGDRKHYQVHRLVAAAFIGEAHRLQVNHKNGIKTDNSIENLEYVTAQQNNKHAYDTGLRKPHRNMGKIDERIAEEIKIRIDGGEKQKDLAKEFRLSPQAVCDIANGRTWNMRLDK